MHVVNGLLPIFDTQGPGPACVWDYYLEEGLALYMRLAIEIRDHILPGHHVDCA